MNSGKGEQSRPVHLSWFTTSIYSVTPLILEFLFLGFIVRLLALVQPFVFQTLIDRVIPFQRLESLNIILVILVFAMLSSSILTATSNYLSAYTANQLASHMGRRFYEHYYRLPLLTIKAWQIGATTTRVREIETIRRFLTESVSGVVLDVVFAFVFFAALLSISPRLTLVVAIMLPLQIASFGLIGPFLRIRMKKSFQADADYQSELVESIQSIETIKSGSLEPDFSRRIWRSLVHSLQYRFRVAKLNIANVFVSDVLRNGSVILVIFIGSRMVIDGDITFGQLIAFHLLSDRVSGPVLGLSKVWEEWQNVRLARVRLGDLLNAETENFDSLPPLPPTRSACLKAEDITFSYLEKANVLNKLSAVFPDCTLSVIAGASGVGKSTLAKALAGLISVNSGSVLFGGHDISSCSPSDIRRKITYVPQEPNLFSGSVRDNVRLLNPDADEDEIVEALKKASFADFDTSLTQGLDSLVGEHGANLSLGQRQRISLARAFLAKTEVIIFDEPTSSLDEKNALQVMRSLQELSIERNIIVITHHPELIDGEYNRIDLARLSREADSNYD